MNEANPRRQGCSDSKTTVAHSIKGDKILKDSCIDAQITMNYNWCICHSRMDSLVCVEFVDRRNRMLVATKLSNPLTKFTILTKFERQKCL